MFTEIGMSDTQYRLQLTVHEAQPSGSYAISKFTVKNVFAIAYAKSSSLNEEGIEGIIGLGRML